MDKDKDTDNKNDMIYDYSDDLFFIKDLLEDYIKNIKKYWLLIPLYPFAWILYKSLFSDNKDERDFYKGIILLIVFLSIGIFHFKG